MPQENMNPGKDESKAKTFDPATTIACTVTAGSGAVTINDESTPRIFGGGAGQIRSQAYNGVTKITIKGASMQNKFRVDF